MKTPIEQFVDKTNDIRLSDEAKLRIRSNLVVHMQTHPVVLSPYQKLAGILSPYTVMLRRSTLALVIFLFVAVGGVTTFAAKGSLPGDPLYKIKVDVIEPIRGLIAISPKAKAVWHTSIIEERLNEVEELAKKDKLTTEEGTKSVERFNHSIDEVRSNIEKLSQDDPETAKEIDDSLEVSLNRHEDALKEVESISSSTSSIEAGAFVELIRNGSRNKRERDSEDNR